MNIEAFSVRFSRTQQSIIYWVNDLLMKQPGIYCQNRYGVPFYGKMTWICYINPKKNNALELVFIRGQELSNSEEILETHARKIVAGILLHRIPNPELAKKINTTLQEALLLDEAATPKQKKPFGKPRFGYLDK